MKKLKLSALAAIALMLTHSCGQNDTDKTTSSQEPIIVEVLQLASSDNVAAISSSGLVKASEHADISTRNMGYVLRVNVEIGEQVNKGQLLIKLSNDDLQAKWGQVSAQVNEATAAFSNAKTDYERFKNLYSNNSASQKELDDATSRFEMAEARLQSAEQMKQEVSAQFAYSNIRAPFDGFITAKYVNPGDLASPGMPLLSMENPNQLEILARIPEHLISQIEVNSEVNVSSKTIARQLKGTITEKSNSSLNTGGQFIIKVALQDPPEALRSGMFVTVMIPMEESVNVSSLFVPNAALIKRGQLTGVFAVSQSNTAILRWLRLGREMGDSTEVLSGLGAGESIIIGSDTKLFNGAKISVKNTNALNSDQGNSEEIEKE